MIGKYVDFPINSRPMINLPEKSHFVFDLQSDGALSGNSLKSDIRLSETVARNSHPLQHCEMEPGH